MPLTRSAPTVGLYNGLREMISVLCVIWAQPDAPLGALLGALLDALLDALLTQVPTDSPSQTRCIAPGSLALKTWIGRSWSRASMKADWSITLRPSRTTSSKVIVS